MTRPVSELRVVLVAERYEDALRFYRDALGLPVMEVFDDQGGRGVLFEAGRATLELLDETHAAIVDDVEVGRKTAGRIRFAFEVDDSVAVSDRLVDAGGHRVSDPVITPWQHQNVRVSDPDDNQLTLFTVL